jgi:predicted nucleic acid-binding protein
MIIVSDASAIIALAIINRLNILKELFHEIIIPTAVFNEIVIHGSQRPGAEAVQNSKWITVRSVLQLIQGTAPLTIHQFTNSTVNC